MNKSDKYRKYYDALEAEGFICSPRKALDADSYHPQTAAPVAEKDLAHAKVV